ncbi:MAG: V-type ATPase subunit [bacterium]
MSTKTTDVWMKRLSEYRLPFKYDTSYAYGVGRIRALETRLLTRQEMARLVAAEGVEALYRLLAETDYGQTLTPAADPDRFEELLNAHLASALDLAVRLSKDPEVTGLLKSRYDYDNLKVLLKAKLLGQDLDHALSNLGQVELGALARAVEGEGLGDIPGQLRRAIRAVEELPLEGIDPQELDVIVDREMFSFLLSVLKRSRIPFLWGWLEREIDLVNIRTFLRLRWTQQRSELLRQGLCEGGSLAVEFYRALQDEPLEGLAQRFGSTRYARLVDEGISALQSRGSFGRLEQLCDGFLISYLRRARYATFGVEPLVAYVLTVEFEIKAVRAVVVSKWNRIPPESIRERLPSVYV